MDTLERLRQDLWERWRQQLERFPLAVQKPHDTGKIVYARGPIFDLKTYTPRTFRPRRRHSSQPIPGCDNSIYALDTQGRPVYMETRHSYNKIDWRGVYDYTPHEVQYAKWCLQTGVCSQYDRMTLEDGQPRTFQRLTINSGGSVPAWRGLAPAKLMDRISSDPRNYSIWIEAYDVRDGRIQSGDQYTEGLGSPPMRATLAYTYSGGKLERIVHRWESGEEQTIFAARRPVNVKTLSTELSQRIAERAIELLRGAEFNSPLVALEMNYRSQESYVPALIPATERDRISSLNLVITIPTLRWIELREEDFAPAIADFRGRLDKTGGWQAGTRMLREAARQVTESARTQLHTTPSFVAFAVDWEMEGDELETILRQCGATPESLKEFRARGWI